MSFILIFPWNFSRQVAADKSWGQALQASTPMVLDFHSQIELSQKFDVFSEFHLSLFIRFVLDTGFNLKESPCYLFLNMLWGSDNMVQLPVWIVDLRLTFCSSMLLHMVRTAILCGCFLTLIQLSNRNESPSQSLVSVLKCFTQISFQELIAYLTDGK